MWLQNREKNAVKERKSALYGSGRLHSAPNNSKIRYLCSILDKVIVFTVISKQQNIRIKNNYVVLGN